MATFGTTEQYSGGNDALQHEKRMSEWQRANMLSPQQRESVQTRMTMDPWDNTASTRLERLNYQEAADPVAARQSQNFRDAMALAQYRQPQEQNSNGSLNIGSYSQAQRGAQQAQQSDPGNGFAVGEVPDGNGGSRRAVYPTAGHYGQYLAKMSDYGLAENPSPEAYSFAKDQAEVDPTKRYIADAGNRSATIKGDAYVAKAGLTADSKNADRLLKRDIATSRAGGKKAGSLTDGDQADFIQSSEKDYQGYLKQWRQANNDVKGSMMQGPEAGAYFSRLGIPYDGTPGMPVSKAKFLADKQAERAVTQGVTQGSAPGATQAQPPQAPQNDDVQQVTKAMQVLQQQYRMTPHQAQQEILRRVSTKDPATKQRVMAALSQSVDTFLAPQVGR